jgi:bifunctional DNase/RNase
MSDMIEVVIDSIRVSLMSQQRMVILREVNAERYLPIFIGIYEAQAIEISLQEVEVERPLTWDLLKNMVTTLNARVTRVEVIELREDIFYGNVVVEADGRIFQIDSRPSDALALAVRTRVPIFVAREIMDTAGITPEEDLQQRAARKVEKPAETESEGGEERLSVFEDFLDKLDLDNIGGEENADKPE